MDAPRRADHGLSVGDNQMAGLLGLAVHVKDPGIGSHVKIQVHLHTSLVRVSQRNLAGCKDLLNEKLLTEFGGVVGFHVFGMMPVADVEFHGFSSNLSV